jgi:hypothetical protein
MVIDFACGLEEHTQVCFEVFSVSFFSFLAHRFVGLHIVGYRYPPFPAFCFYIARASLGWWSLAGLGFTVPGIGDLYPLCTIAVGCGWSWMGVDVGDEERMWEMR